MAKKSTTKAAEKAEKPKKAAAAKKTAKKPAAPAKKKPAKAVKEATQAAAKEDKKTETAKKALPTKKKIHIEKIKYREKKDTTALKTLRKKTPRFVRQEFGKFAKLEDKWRTPRGCDSKKDEGKRGKGASPKIGYKRPEEVRMMHPTGFYPVMVRNTTEIAAVDPKTQGAIIAAAVGRKKRNDIIKAANERAITILNPRKGEI